MGIAWAQRFPRRLQASRSNGSVWRLVVMIAGVALTAHAQLDRTALTGVVNDAHGRVLPDTQVTTVENETGAKRATVTTATGTYDIPELAVGVYTVTFSHKGFLPLVFQGVTQVVEQTRTLNATLE